MQSLTFFLATRTSAVMPDGTIAQAMVSSVMLDGTIVQG
jgi:hypothetical protein